MCVSVRSRRQRHIRFISIIMDWSLQGIISRICTCTSEGMQKRTTAHDRDAAYISRMKTNDRNGRGENLL